ncbi:hypothetical protein BDW74DRAFT_169636 [Aspergillus multicolor]|uniref:cytochrome P450 n=1 Tax=Aspergillus multicolor TaxID=41759 RepID=UPI003CCE29DC
MSPLAEHSISLLMSWPWVFPFTPIIWLLGYCVYNAVFHPLAKYPGPFVAKFTILRATYHAWKGDVHLDTWRCHQLYGPVVRYGPDRLVFSSPNAVRDIYSVTSNVSKDPTYAALGEDKLNLVSLVNTKEHARRRKMIASSFSFSNVKAFEPAMLEYVQEFLDVLWPPSQSLRSSWGPPTDISSACCHLTFDVMTDFLFGLKYDLLRDSTWRHLIHDIEVTNVRLYVLAHAKFLYLGRVDKQLFPAAVRGSRGFLHFINRVLGDFDAGNLSSHVRPFTRFTEAKDKNGQPLLTAKQISHECAMFMTAAQDTTSITLRAIIFYLSRYTHAYAKLVQEIRTTFRPGEAITADSKLESCVYLQACIKETMRISPAVPATAMYRHVNPGGQTVDGDHLPAGCYVAAGIYIAHHNEDIFPRPFEYIPERWIVDEHTTQEQLDMRLKMWLPFSIGPRACIGKTFAQTLISVTVASLVNQYDFRVPDGYLFGENGGTNPRTFQLQDHIVATGVGPVVQLRRQSEVVP